MRMDSSRIRLAILAASLLFVLASCTAEQTAGVAPSPAAATPEAAETATLSASAETNSTATVDYWLKVFPEGYFPSGVFEQQSEEYPMAELISGLHHETAVVRWFCSYKLAEHPDEVDDAVLADIKRLAVEDPNEQVRQAAKFSASVIGKTYEGEAFVRSPDGKTIAYHSFQEARFNNGRVWLVTDGNSRLFYESEPSVTGLNFSPDGKQLVVGFGGRLWNRLAVLDVEGKKETDLPDLIGMIMANPKNGYDSIKTDEVSRFDPYVTFKSWSPDSRQFLFAYQFGDKDLNTLYGCAVYDTAAKKVTRIYKLTTDGRDVDPEGFHW